MTDFRRWLAGVLGSWANKLYPHYSVRTGDYGHELTEEQVKEYMVRGARAQLSAVSDTYRILDKG